MAKLVNLKFLSYLSGIYLASLFFTDYQIFQININQFIRISEFIFIFIIIYFLFLLLLKKINIFFSIYDLLFFCLPILYFISFLYQKSSVFGFISYLYLFLVYFIFKNIFLNKIKLKYLYIFFLITSLLISITTIIGWFLLFFQKTNFFFGQYHYPYFFLVEGRAKGFFETSTKLIFFNTIAIILFLRFKKEKYIIFNLICSILTYSKSLLIYPLLLPIIYKNNFLKNIIYKLFAFLLIFVLFFHTFFLIKKFDFPIEKLNKITVISEIQKNYKDTNLIPTTYFFINQRSLKLISMNFSHSLGNFLLGSGYKSFELKGGNILDQKTTRAHSLYFETLIEIGILGLIILICIFYKLFKIIKNINNKKNFFLCFLIFVLIEGFFSSLITFKILWIFFSLVSSYDIRQFKIFKKQTI